MIKILRNKRYLLIFLIWLVGFFLRVYRQGDLLGFYYDQGRDALEVRKIIQLENLPAIGPTTGLEGIFLGPFWFYLLAPFYLIGGGSPVIAAIGISLIESLSIILLYLFSRRFFDEKTAVLSSLLWAFSYYIIRSSRWFSNPSPLPFFTILLIWGLAEWLIKENYQWIWVVFLSLGISLQLEAASAIFYLPAVLWLVWVYKPKIRKTVKTKSFLIGLGIFFLLLIPQIGFEFKNNFLMTRNFVGFFTGKRNTDSGQSWALPTAGVVGDRINYYYGTFFTKLDPNLKLALIPAIIWLVILSFIIFKRRKKPSSLHLIYIFWLTPLILLLFFVGNYGNLYDYYLTGFFPLFFVLFGWLISQLPWLFILPVLGYFFLANGRLNYHYLRAGVDGETHVTLGNQKQAIKWVCNDRGEADFNVDTYVPPVIPYAWDYLWIWYGGKLACQPSDEISDRLYTIWEVDSSHPERLDKWLERQAGIGKIIKKVRFGGIGTEKRERIK